MITVKAEDIFNLDLEQIWNLKEEKINVQCTDGIVETHTRAIIFTWYTTEYNRIYGTPYTVDQILPLGEILRNNTSVKYIERSLFNTYDHIKDLSKMEELCLLAYQVTNSIYNDFTSRVIRYAGTINIFDFIDVFEEPSIKEANDSLLPTDESIMATYKVIDRVLTDKNTKTLKKNNLYLNYISGMVSPGQIKQCVGPRGYLTDIDSNIFRYPVLSSYVGGIRTLADSMMESRSAAKSVIFNSIKISVTEYFNRELQLFNTILSRVEEGDCGTNDFLNFTVQEKDLGNIAGKYMYTNNGLVVVKDTDRHLIGKTVALRSSLKCKHPNQYTVCSTCFGELFISIPVDTNIGYVSSGILGEKGSQTLMGTKHLDGTSKTDDFEISVLDKRYIKLENFRQDDAIVNSIKLIGSFDKTTLVLSGKEAQGLSEIDYKEVSDLNIASLTAIRNIQLIKGDGEFTETIDITVAGGIRVGWLSEDFLRYIKTVGYQVSDKGNYIVDLSKWFKTKPFIILPMKQTDIAKYVRDVKSYVMTCGKKTARSKTIGTDKLLMGLYKLITSKLQVNLAHIEIIMLAEMVTSLEPRDHNIPTDRTTGEIATYRDNVMFRSMGSAMAYQGQGRILTNPEVYLYKDRPNSIFDEFLCPKRHKD